MRAHHTSSGFALLLVLWSLVILSAVAIGFAASVTAEVRSSQTSWDDLQAERLAKSGHDVATYLETRALGTTSEDLSGLPVKPLLAGLKYQVTFDTGTVDLVLEGENRKLDLFAADEATTTAFFSTWTADINRGNEIAASLADWKDYDDDPRLLGAEAFWYRPRGYAPRNAGLGAADLPLVRGLTPEDLGPSVLDSKETTTVRGPLSWFISAVPSGNAVNPNYADRATLESLPDMNPRLLGLILQSREQAIFTSAEDFRNRTGVFGDTPLLNYLAFDRGSAPAVLAIAHLRNSAVVRTERRTQRQIRDQRRRGPTIRLLGLVERYLPPQ